MRTASRHQQRGSVIVTVSLMLFFLLGSMAFALDFGRAFVTKAELQSAMDGCALSAAQELDGAGDSITRALSAGKTAGNLNGVHFQSATWSGKGQITDADIKFYDTNLVATAVPASAKYVECMHTHPGMQLLLLASLNSFAGGTSFPDTHDIVARAVATRASAQSSCPIPVALRPKAGHQSDPKGSDYGFTTGEWVTMLTDPSTGTFGSGQAGWMNLDGSNNANETKAELNGKCGVQTDDPLGTPGAKVAANDMWNYRFGIYGGGPTQGPSHYGTPGVTNDPNQRPDFTGYSYTAKNWPAQSNAYADFKNKRAAFASCGDTIDTKATCESITGLTLNSYRPNLATHGTSGEHWQYGTSRRIVLVPVVSATQTVQDFACMLMLQPLSIPAEPTVQLEYIGNAGAVGSPCTTNGLPGGSAGPLVPVLVR